MRLTGLFSARESLITHGTAIAQVSDNLANANTTAYKASRTEFEDLFVEGPGSLFGEPVPVGSGNAVDRERVLQDKQGTINFTDRSLDAAIDGSGFFSLTDGTDIFYTRAGVFSVDGDGNVVTSDGSQLMGYTTASPETAVALSVAGTTLSAAATTTVTLTGNADASAPILTAGVPAATDFQTLTTAADFTTPVSVIDSLGASHELTLYYFHTGVGTYTIQAYADGGETAGGTVGAPVQVGTADITFDSAGQQAAGAASTMTLNATWANGAAAQSSAVDLSGITGFAAPSNIASVDSDGSSAGAVVGYEIEEDGTFNVLFDTGGKVSAGTIALASFHNASGLARTGQNNFTETDESGTPLLGTPSTEGRGALVGGALENSTVDPTNEFVDLIRYQRAYQAGAQVIQTYSELLNTTIQIT